MENCGSTCGVSAFYLAFGKQYLCVYPGRVRAGGSAAHFFEKGLQGVKGKVHALFLADFGVSEV